MSKKILFLATGLIVSVAFFVNIQPAAAASITVTSPNGGESLEKGKIYDITWTIANDNLIGNDISLHLSKANDTSFSYTLNLPTLLKSTGASTYRFSWVIPDFLDARSDYKVSVVLSGSEGIQSFSDQSNSTFSIVAAGTPSIAVTSPNGGEKWEVGKTNSIKYQIKNDKVGGQIDIGYLRSDGSRIMNIGRAITSTGAGSYDFAWLIPANFESGNDYKIIVQYYHQSFADIVLDESDEPFSIVAAGTPSITVLSPNGGESWKVGETHRISWMSTGIQNVTMYLYDNRISGSGAIVNYPVPNNQPVSASQGYYDWTILSNVLQANDGKNFQIIIQDANNYQLSDKSNAPFSIVAAGTPSITVLSPNGGETWEIGKGYDIRWSNKNPSINSAADIQLYKGGNSILVIDTNLGSNLSENVYRWTIPLNLTPSNDYKIVVFGGGTNMDFSDAAFSIVAAGTPSITVLSPNGGEQFTQGETVNIRWSMSGLTTNGSNNIDLIYPDGKVFYTIYASNILSTTSYSWNTSTIPPGQYKIKITSYDPATNVTTYDYSDAAFSIVAVGTLTITTSSLSSGTVGIAYVSETLSASGGNGTYDWSVTGLPAGLSFCYVRAGTVISGGVLPSPCIEPGKIHGTPTTAGTYTVNVTVTSGTQSVSKQFSLVIAAAGTLTTCLPDNTLIKMPDDPKVYVIIDCQKKWIQTAEEFKQQGFDWSAVQEVNSPVIQAYADYLQATANLLRAIGQEKVYKVVNGKLLWIPTISAFNAQGLKWSDVQSVDISQLNQYQRVKLIQANGDEKVYYITESGLKRHIPNETVFSSYNNKWEDIVELAATDVNSYPDATLIKAEDGYQVYKLENGQKRWIKTDAAFRRLKLDWNKVVPVNSTELAAYPDGPVIE